MSSRICPTVAPHVVTLVANVPARFPGTRATASAKSLRLLTYLSALVIVTGFGVMGMADPKYDLSITTPWVLGSLILYVIAVALTLGIVIPTYLHPERREPKQRYSRAAASSGIATISLVAVVVLMVWKP